MKKIVPSMVFPEPRWGHLLYFDWLTANPLGFVDIRAITRLHYCATIALQCRKDVFCCTAVLAAAPTLSSLTSKMLPHM